MKASSSDVPFEIPDSCISITATVTGSVWSISVKPGDRVEVGDNLVVVEAMKMEIAIDTDEAGRVREVLCTQGTSVKAGQVLIILEIEE